ncbi:FtsW/RodA/SpoVE family cell cycle protein [Streptococcus cuniculipharyngis]|uniref:FtsW/RodA/SpoVE family cell cycle protein n=1 Tax=Streptococcus cuniculipharyngis TaxID=1562651 RepID=A0A5C5SD61_9STRE|nr:FtsW/RodA/SpoVE family cell cycle protein [Streptococcus cuniculipharyngis]TWS99027.1 FtsW/RodA/SpoVE family cell cycle protein [Streptococcus cuniculipharyngis]
MAQKKSIDSRIDYSVILPVFCLLLVGLLAVYVASYHDNPQMVWTIIGQQFIWIVLGCLIGFVVMFFSTAFLWKVTPALYLLGLIIMVLPLIFFSPRLVEATGAKNWVSIGSVTLFQPSEFMKISYILALSRLTLWFNQDLTERRLKDDLFLLLGYVLLTLPVLTLLALQKDLGTAIVFLAILAGLIVISGISWKIIWSMIGLVGLSFLSFILIFLSENGREWFHRLGMSTYQINRISAWINPFDYADNIAYQQTQSMIAIGTGGLQGKGFNVADLSVPVRESDMIFTVIGENFGFIGSVAVLGLYLLLIYRMLRVTFLSNNVFYTYISTGFIMMILFHIFENIGASLGILPLTGIPLPFISQGGSSLISNLIGVGLILSMSYQNQLMKEKGIEQRFRRSRSV